jgi:hypothetical protein
MMRIGRWAGALLRTIGALSIMTAARAEPKLAWEVMTDGGAGAGADLAYGQAEALALDDGGNLLVGGTLADWSFAVTKLSAATGATLWQRTLPNASNFHYWNGVAALVARGGNVYAAGWTTIQDPKWEFTVVRLSGANGTPIWQRTFHNATNNSDAALALAADGAGNLFAAGELGSLTSQLDFTVVKLDAGSGNVSWSRSIAAGTGAGSLGGAHAVAVDAQGNPIAAGNLGVYPASDFTVVKLSGATGAELWQRRLPSSVHRGSGEAVMVDGAGNAIVSGTLDGAFTVIAFSAASGAELWRYQGPPTTTSVDHPSRATSVRRIRAGAVLVGGYGTKKYDPRAMIVELDEGSGAEKWKQQGPALTWGQSLTTPKGAVVASGGTHRIVVAAATENGRVAIFELDEQTGVELWRWKSDATGSRLPTAAVLRGRSLFVVGTAYPTAQPGQKLWATKLVIDEPCAASGKKGCGCAKCGAHERCVEGECRSDRPAKPGGPMHTDRR